MFGTDLNSLPEVREGSGGPFKGPGLVGRPSRKSRNLSQKSGRGQEALPEVRDGWEALLEFWDRWEALPEVRDGSGGPFRGSGRL